MNVHKHSAPASLALFTLAEIKAASEAFEAGDTNVFDALDAIIEALEDFRAAADERSRRDAA